MMNLIDLLKAWWRPTNVDASISEEPRKLYDGRMEGFTLSNPNPRKLRPAYVMTPFDFNQYCAAISNGVELIRVQQLSLFEGEYELSWYADFQWELEYLFDEDDLAEGGEAPLTGVANDYQPALWLA